MTRGSGHHGKHCNQELINWIRLSWDRHESWPAVVWIPSVEDNSSREENVTGLALESSRAHRHEEWHFMINYTTRSSDSISISIAIERANKKPTIMKCWRDKIGSSRVVKQVVYFSLSVALRPHIDVYNFNQYIEFSFMIYMTRDLFLLFSPAHIRPRSSCTKPAREWLRNGNCEVNWPLQAQYLLPIGAINCSVAKHFWSTRVSSGRFLMDDFRALIAWLLFVSPIGKHIFVLNC